jgi:SulP family sulfate permease
MQALLKNIPLITTLKTYDRTTFKGDLVAGLTTAIMLIPQGMAYAMLAGLDPIIGLYASIVPLIAYAVFGTSRQLAVGPVAMVSLLVASSVGAIAEGGSQEYLAYAVMLAAMVGVLQLGMGVARLGFLVNFLSHPVVAGFTSAAALIIGFSQLKHLLGVNIHRSHHVHDILLQAVEHFAEWHWMTVGIGVATVVALMTMKKFTPKVPRFLVVVAVSTLAVWGFGLEGMGVKIVGDVPAGLPAPSLPVFDLEAFNSLLPMAITIALVGFMESISVAKNFARANKYEIDANQELKGLGMANILGSLFSAYPTTGGFSRTAVNAQAGARTGVAAIITALAVAVTLLFLTPLFYFLPKAVLAAIIMTAVFGLVDIAEARHLWKVSRPDLAMMAITFLATLTLGIEQGILVGVAASLAWFVKRVSTPHIAVLGRMPGMDIYRKLERNEGAHPVPGILMVRIDAPLFYANAGLLKSTLKELEAERDDVQHVVIDAKGIGDVDASAIGALEELLEDYEDRGVQLWMAGVHGPVMDALDRAHFVEKLGSEHCVYRVHHAVEAIGPQLTLHRAIEGGAA